MISTSPTQTPPVLSSLIKMDELREAAANSINDGTGLTLERRGNLDVISSLAEGGESTATSTGEQNMLHDERQGGRASWPTSSGAALYDVVPELKDAGFDSIGLCNLATLWPFTFNGEPWNSWPTHEGFATMALAAEHFNTGNGSIVPALQGINEWCPSDSP